VILSLHLSAGGPSTTLSALRARPRPARVPGLLWAQTALTVPLAAGFARPPRPTGAGLITAWGDDAVLDEFLAHNPLKRPHAAGWHVRLEPLRASGAWSALPELPGAERPVDDDEPVAVITLGRLRLRRAVPFLRASGAAERQAVADPAVVLSTAFVRPPRLLGTFSVWRSAVEMRAYAYGASGHQHVSAIRGHRANPFHHESVFMRFRPYGAAGSWRGLRPLTDRTVSQGDAPVAGRDPAPAPADASS
jgi:hypothetical protein